MLTLRIVLSGEDAFEKDLSESPTLGRGKQGSKMDMMMMMMMCSNSRNVRFGSYLQCPDTCTRSSYTPSCKTETSRTGENCRKPCRVCKKMSEKMSRLMTKLTKWHVRPAKTQISLDQPRHPPSLIRVFAVRMKKAWVLSYPLSAQRRL